MAGNKKQAKDIKPAKKVEKANSKKVKEKKLAIKKLPSKTRKPTDYSRLKKKQPHLEIALKVLKATSAARTGYTPMTTDSFERYNKTIKSAILKNKLSNSTLNEVSKLIYSSRQTLRERFTARLQFISDKGKVMGEGELIGVLAEDVESFFSRLKGYVASSTNSLYYAFHNIATAMKHSGKLSDANIANTDTGVVGEIVMDYTFA